MDSVHPFPCIKVLLVRPTAGRNCHGSLIHFEDLHSNGLINLPATCFQPSAALCIRGTFGWQAETLTASDFLTRLFGDGYDRYYTWLHYEYSSTAAEPTMDERLGENLALNLSLGYRVCGRDWGAVLPPFLVSIDGYVRRQAKFGGSTSTRIRFGLSSDLHMD
jgi:hypothetical protein